MKSDKSEVQAMRGFKRTEVGLIPRDWDCIEFGAICELSKNRINPILNRIDYKCIELEHLSQDSGILLEYISSNNTLSQKNIFKKGDVLFGKLRPYLKKFWHAHFNGVCSTEIWVLKAKNYIDDSFLFQVVRSERIIEAANISIGTKMPRAEWKTVAETKIPLPATKAEQTAIATALNDADILITALGQLLAKKRAIKQGATQELLRPKIGWEEKKLGEIIKNIQLGGNYKNEENITEYPLIKMGNIQRGFIVLNKVDYIQGNKFREKDRLKYGDILFNTRNTLDLVGKVAIWKDELPIAYFNSNIMRIEFKNEYISSNFFMNSLFNTDYLIKNLKTIAIGTTSVAAIYTRDLLNIDISFPKFPEQISIAQILADMDAEIELLEQKLEKQKQVKQGMMQVLLTGKVRLV